MAGVRMKDYWDLATPEKKVDKISDFATPDESIKDDQATGRYQVCWITRLGLCDNL